MRLPLRCVPLLLCLLIPQAGAYDVTPIPFQWAAFTGTPVPLGDNEMSGAIPLPFSFTFLYDYPYLIPQAAVHISSNGFITFAAQQSDGCTGQPAPCGAQELPAGGSPNGLIAGFWEDLNPQAGGEISYGTTGSAPNRTFIVEFDGVPHAPSGNPVSFQIKLFEASRVIEIHCKSCPSDGGRHTQGIEGFPRPNQGGTTGAACYTTNPYLNPNLYGYQCRRRACVGGSNDRLDCAVAGDCPGGTCTTILGERNAANFSLANDAIRFTPPNNRAAIAPATVSPGPGRIVGVRYRFRVDANQGLGGSPPEFKLIYLPTRLYDAPNYSGGVNPDTYLLNGFFYTNGNRYTDPICGVTYGFPPDVVTTVPQASFRLQIPDYVQKGFTGARTDQPASFPRSSSTGAIDGIAAAIGLEPQFDVAGMDGAYELRRGSVIADESGWRNLPVNCDPQGHCSCQDAGLDPAHPGHAFRQWDMTIALGGNTYTTHAALPDDAATSVTPWEILSVATEYFFTQGRFRVYLWDVEVQTDAAPTWQPIDRWYVTDHDGSARYFGFKLASYAGHCVIEVSTDPSSSSAYPFGASGFSNTTLDLSSCTVSPTAVTGGATGVTYDGATLDGIVNANGETGNAWFEYGPVACNVGACTATAPQAVSGSIDAAVSIPVGGLAPGGSYHFRLVAQNAGGTVVGTDATFSTAPAPCSPQPTPGCAQPRSASIALKRNADPARHKLKLKWSGSSPGPLDLGDPRTTTTYALCLYDEPATGPRGVMVAAAPAAGSCASKPCWVAAPAPYAFKYSDRDRTPDGIKTLQVKSLITGSGTVKLSGSGAMLPVPALPLSAPVTVQVQASNGTCLEAAFETAIRKNDAEQFSARADVP